jgi:hypothetical protein
MVSMGANEGHSELRANEQARTARHPNAQRPRGIHRSHTYVPYTAPHSSSHDNRFSRGYADGGEACGDREAEQERV